ncbi:hypothetical protein PSPO_a2063 [Pseudoalteromonas spongiae UST010723-006]|nr:hypothetical protein PSPO_a2063 [Pseudoalteromonas spongiae UST010723-006]
MVKINPEKVRSITITTIIKLDYRDSLTKEKMPVLHCY